ncbi:HNH endonuclease, partial [Pseudomonas sp. p1(2021b)]|uniref:HNH endonuclease n=1 Tax=Pseudomonas sp. p1(2021b) TaxID=2874628 RepID=UPI003D2E7B70
RRIPYSGADLRLMFSYEPATGAIRWKERPVEQFASPAHCKSWNRRLAGALAGTRRHSTGKVYIQLAIAGRFFPAHRVIWLMVHDAFDESLEIDHVNGDGTDNRLANLRLVSHQENQKNLARRFDNVSGVTGVAWDPLRGKWLVRGHVSGRQKNLGRFDDFEAAVAVRRRHERENGYHDLHGMGREDKAAAV